MKEEKQNPKNKIFTAILIIGLLWLISATGAFLLGFNEFQAGNVAVIPLHGMIIAGEDNSLMSSSVSSESIIKSLEKADTDPNIKAIILDINSPGGSPVATDEIGQKLKSINKTKVAVIREVGASGGYWIATTADYIFANRLSITGSIGVYASYLEFSGLMDDYNVTYQRYVSGELKDMGTPFREPTEKEKNITQAIIDKMRIYFIEEVAENRNLSYEYIEGIATGQIYLGDEAKELGLIDYLGTKEDAFLFIGNELNITAVPVEFKETKSFSEILSSFASQFNPKIGKFINPISNSFNLV